MIGTLTELIKHPGAILIFIYFFSYLFKGNALKYLLIISPMVSFCLMVQKISYDQIEFFYISGLLLVLLCGVLFANRKKMTAMTAQAATWIKASPTALAMSKSSRRA